MEGTLAEIRYFGSNFAPRSWLFCHGQQLAISTNAALFSLLGTTFGGDGRTYFNLPDLRGRVPVGTGTGAGLSHRYAGQRSGVESVTLTIPHMPNHSHIAITSNPTVNSASATVKVNGTAAGATSPSGNYPGVSQGAPLYDSTSNATMASDAVEINGITFNPINTQIGSSGGSLPHENMQPWLCLNPIICVQGVFPSRP